MFVNGSLVPVSGQSQISEDGGTAGLAKLVWVGWWVAPPPPQLARKLPTMSHLWNSLLRIYRLTAQCIMNITGIQCRMNQCHHISIWQNQTEHQIVLAIFSPAPSINGGSSPAGETSGWSWRRFYLHSTFRNRCIFILVWMYTKVNVNWVSRQSELKWKSSHINTHSGSVGTMSSVAACLFSNQLEINVVLHPNEENLLYNDVWRYIRKIENFK